MRAMFLSRRSSYYSNFFQSLILLIDGALSLPKAMITLTQWPDRSTAKRQGVDGEEAGGFLGTPQPIKLLPMSRIESSPMPRLIEPSPMPRLIKLLPMSRLIEPFPMPQLIELLPTPPLIETSPMPWLIKSLPTPRPIKSLPMPPRLIKLPSIALPHESTPMPRSFPMPPMLWLWLLVLSPTKMWQRVSLTHEQIITSVSNQNYNYQSPKKTQCMQPSVEPTDINILVLFPTTHQNECATLGT